MPVRPCTTASAPATRAGAVSPGACMTELEVGQLRQVVHDPLRAQLGNAVPLVVSGVEGRGHLRGDVPAVRPGLRPVEPARSGVRHHDKPVHLVGRNACVLQSPASGYEGIGANAGLGVAVPPAVRGGDSYAYGSHLPLSGPNSQPLLGPVPLRWHILNFWRHLDYLLIYSLSKLRPAAGLAYTTRNSGTFWPVAWVTSNSTCTSAPIGTSSRGVPGRCDSSFIPESLPSSLYSPTTATLKG